MRFSHFTAFHTLGVYVAYEKGFFKEEGLDVQMHEASSGAQQPLQLIAGEVDITSTLSPRAASPAASTAASAAAP